MGKRTRAEKRLAEVTTEYGEQQIAEERKTHAQQATDTDLFYIDSGEPNKKSTDKKSRTNTGSINRNNNNISNPISSTNSSTTTTITTIEPPISKVKFLQRKPPKVFTKSPVEEKLIARAAAAAQRPSSSSSSTTLTTLSTTTGNTMIDPWIEKDNSKRLNSVILHNHQRKDVERTTYSKSLPKLSSIFTTTASTTNDGISYNPEFHSHQKIIEQSSSIIQNIVKKKQQKQQLQSTTEELQLDNHDPDDDNDDKPINTNTTLITVNTIKSNTTLTSSSNLTLTNEKIKKLKKGEKRRADKAAFMKELKTAVEEIQNQPIPSISLTKKASQPPVSLISSSLPEEMLDIVNMKKASLGVPLSEELSGSLRKIKPVSASTLLSTQILNISTQGLVHPRNPRHATTQVIENDSEYGIDTVTTLSSRQLARMKRIGNPWKELEFPRRKEFEPAQEALKQIIGPKKK